MKQKKSTEDYLKTIYVLSRQGGVHGAAIAEELGVSRPTVSVSLKALTREGYIWMDQNRLVYLTEAGVSLAKEIYERHQTFRELLLRLGVDPETAARDACEMEHSVGQESFAAIQTVLKRLREADGDSRAAGERHATD